MHDDDPPGETAELSYSAADHLSNPEPFAEGLITLGAGSIARECGSYDCFERPLTLRITDQWRLGVLFHRRLSSRNDGHSYGQLPQLVGGYLVGICG